VNVRDVPPALAADIDGLLRAHGAAPHAATPGDMLAAATTALERFIATASAQQRADTLLAIDALVTGAFAAAVDDAELERLRARAWHDMLSLGSPA
jgi:cytochrome c-type biogenesis protein CcmH/NrfG